jgi:hypothetical protein
MYVQEEPDEPGTDNTRPIQAAFTGGRTCVISNPKLQRTYRAAILATNSTTVYTITATTSSGVTELYGSTPTYGGVAMGHLNFYKF